MPKKPRDRGTSGTGLILVKDGVEREVSFEELALSNTLTLEALVKVLARNGNVDPGELLREMDKVKAERFKGGVPGGDDEPGSH